MRQVVFLLKAANKGEHVDFYESMLSYRSIHMEVLPSLPEFLELTLKEKPQDLEENFDADSDKEMEALALKRLKERRQSLGK